MSQGVLGRALARLLAGARGRQYVQLPKELEAEARALAAAANDGHAEIKAVLVVRNPAPGDPPWIIPSSQLIAWRTDADRIFVFLGGVVEPDSSFATSATPFLTDAFPGTGGGSCSPEQLATATMEVALAQAGLDQAVLEKFALAGRWTIELLKRVLADGAGSLDKLGARLLRAWSAMASDLDDAARLAAASAPPTPVDARDALSVFRLAGLPAPFVDEPWPELDESARDIDLLGGAWLRFIDEHVRINEVNAVLEKLRDSSAIQGDARWTGLPWAEAMLRAQRFSATAPEIGRLLFGRDAGKLVPGGSRRRGDSWDAVSAQELLAAMNALDQGGPRIGAVPDGRFLQLDAQTQGAPLLLDVREANPETRGGAKSTVITLEDSGIRIGGMGSVQVEEDLVPGGGALAVSATVKFSPSAGLKAGEVSLSTTAGELELRFPLDLTIKHQDGRASKWAAKRKLVVTLEVQDNIGGTLQAVRKVTLGAVVVVPSPYWPTVVAVLPKATGDASVAVSPAASVEFVAQGGGWLSPATSPELELDAPANALIAAYDGRWDPGTGAWFPPGTFEYSGLATGVSLDGIDYAANARLLDQATLQLGEDDPVDVTVVRIESDVALPTNALRRRDRTVPLHEPRPEARNTPFGRFQGSVAALVGASRPDELQPSLFQLVVPSGTGELPKDLAYQRRPTALPGAEGPWTGLGDGPSEALARTRAWANFIAAARAVARRGLENGVPDWLSSMDLSTVGANALRRYLEAHRNLMAAATTETDKFWARYPFSVFLVDGNPGPERGSLQAVFLSPLHPARVAWLFSAQVHAESLEGASRLLGLADGWNIPAFGEAPGPGGMTETFVAVPLDPGVDGDNVAWSALVKTAGSGLVRPQLTAAGTRLPWGGRSGLNERVVAQALDDYVAAHPHASSLQVELRAAVEAPRSAEVDRAVISWVDRKGAGVGGVIRVIDSAKRQGRAPGRDDLPERSDRQAAGRFTWQVRGEGDPLPGHVDIAFVENTAPFTRLIPGEATAPNPALPLRRFTTAVDNQVAYVDYQHGARKPDILGLGELLAMLEPAGATMRVVTTMDSLQASDAVRWEVIGDINLEPAQMARLARSAPGPKQLWEWRPGWMSTSEVEAVRGAHYVLARAPQSLVAGLRANLGLSSGQTDELLGELGSRGIGLGTLRRPGSTQEGEAAGLFLAGRLLTGFKDCQLPPKWLGEGRFAGLIPLDPIHGIVDALGETPAGRSRADLALVVVDCTGSGGPRIKVTPIECKHRGGFERDGLPPSGADRKAAAGQVKASATALGSFVDAVASASGERALLQASARLQVFATLVDLAMKFGPDEPTPAQRSAMVQDVVDGLFSLEIGDGVAIWSLKQEDVGQRGVVATNLDDGVGHVQFIPAAASALAWTGQEPAEALRQDRLAFDAFCAKHFLPSTSDVTLLDVPGLLRSALLGVDPGDEPSHPGDPDCPDEAPGGSAEPGRPDPASDDDAESPAVPGDGGPAEPTGQPASATRGAEVDPVAPAANDPGPPLRSAPEVDRDAPPAPSDAGSTAGDTEELHAAADLFLGAETATRFTVVGKLANTGQVVALDLDHPKAIGVFGYMGSGKSYLLGALMEGAAMPIPALSTMRSPLAVVVFNYRRNAADRFELSSLVRPNRDAGDMERLHGEYSAAPQPIAGLDVLCMPGELAGRRVEYEGAVARELYFDPQALDVEDWELLMGEPGSDAVFARVIRATLQDLRRQGGITIEGVRELLEEKLPRGSMSAAEIRLEAVERIVSSSHGVDFGEILRPGRVLAIDLRQPMFNREDAMKLILVCANQIAKQRTAFNKLVVFDEAHEYMTEAFGDRFDARIRYMRHEGSSYVFATQDVGSIPTSIRRHLGTNFVFSLETRDNITDLLKAAPEFSNLQLQHLPPGSCYAVSSRSTGNVFRSPRLLSVRPRATAHGGQSRIFDGDA